MRIDGMKPLWVTLIGALVTATLTAQPNQQKIYRLRSPEYETVRTLYIEQGLALPFATGPFSEAELRAALDRLDLGRLSAAGRRSFDRLMDRFSTADASYREEDDRFVFDANVELNLEAYLHTDADNPYWEYRWERRLPLVALPLEAWVLENAYGYVNFELKKNIPDFRIYPTYSRSRQYAWVDGEFEFTTEEQDPFTNVPYVVNTIDVQFPYRAFLSFGGDRWNVQLGRDIIDWGNGRTGNLYVSDAADWHDMVRLTTFWDRFKFSFFWINLDASLTDAEREYRYVGQYTGSGADRTPAAELGDGSGHLYLADIEQKHFIAHRFEIRLGRRVGLSATEGYIVGRDHLQLRHLNPLYHYHNHYLNTHATGNTHRSYEFDVAIAPGVSFYAALSPDQWTSPLEPGTDLTDEPNALSYLAGFDARRALGEGYLHGTLEGVYLSPWMYIHNHPLTSITTRRYVMAQHGSTVQTFYDKPLGHYGGNDFALLWLDVGYRLPGAYRYGMTTYVEGDGANPINALLSMRRGFFSESQERSDYALTEDEATAGAPSSIDGEPQWRVAARLYGEIEPWFWSAWNGPTGRKLSIFSELGFQWMKNRFNQPSDWEFDLQLALSVRMRL